MLQFTLTAATAVWMSYIIITLIIIHVTTLFIIIIHVTTLFIIIIHVTYNTYYHTCVIHVSYMCHTCVVCCVLCCVNCALCMTM